MRKEPTDRPVSHAKRVLCALVAAVSIVALVATPVSASDDDDNTENPVTDTTQNGGQGTTIEVQTSLDYSADFDDAGGAQEIINQGLQQLDSFRGCGGGAPNCRIRVLAADGTIQTSCTFSTWANGGCGGGGSSTSTVHVSPPAPPPQPTRPAKPIPPVPTMECRTAPPADTSLIAETSFDVTADSSTGRFEYRVLWSRSNNRAGASASMTAEIAAARRALAHAQSQSTQQAAADAAADAEAARTAAETAAETLHDAREHYEATDATATAALANRDAVYAAATAAQAAAAAADSAVTALRTADAPTLTAMSYSADPTLTTDAHALRVYFVLGLAEVALTRAEEQRDAALLHAADADSPVHPAGPPAVEAADLAAEAAQVAADAYTVANAHFVLIWDQRTAADTAFGAAQVASLTAAADHAAAVAAADAAAVAADVDAAQQTLDTLVAANDANVLLLDDAPTISSGTGRSSIGSPPIASFDHLYVSVSIRTSVRTSASNAGGTSWSPWSDWSHWSDWSQRAGNGGDPWIDTNGNGRWDPAEPFTDTNGNGAYDRGDPFDDYNNNGVRDVDVDVLFDYNDNDLWDSGEPLYDANGNHAWDGGFVVDVDPNISSTELSAITRQWFGNVSEPYHDADGDGTYDAPEAWTDILNGTYDPGETFTDQGNGSYDPDEPWTDANSNGIYDPPVGCPIPNSPSTPINTLPCSHNPTLIAAVYPPSHPLAGQRTGHCYPFGSPCLPPPDGTGANDVVCLPRGS